MNIINDVLKKLMVLEKETSEEKGSYDLFALFLRESANKWDILVSAPWINREGYESSLRYVAEKVQSSLDQKDFRLISKVVIIDNTDPELSLIHQNISVEHGSFEIRDVSLFGQDIRHAYVVTSRSRQAA